MMAVMLGYAQSKKDMCTFQPPVEGWIQQCPQPSKQHQYPKLCQEHQELPSGLPSLCCPSPKFLNFSVQMGTGASNMAAPEATNAKHKAN